MISIKQKHSLIFEFWEEKIISLHMFFVFYPIDVLFLNKNKVVVDKKDNFRPFTFYKSKRKAAYAIELPYGTLNKTKTDIGDKIGFWNILQNLVKRFFKSFVPSSNRKLYE